MFMYFQYYIIIYNYVFKYANLKDEDEFVNFTILNNDNKLVYKESSRGNVITKELHLIKVDIEPGQANIAYFFKVIENKTFIYGENIYNIDVTE